MDDTAWDDVNAELCDVILAATVALATIAPDARKIFAQRLDHVSARSRHRRPGA